MMIMMMMIRPILS